LVTAAGSPLAAQIHGSAGRGADADEVDAALAVAARVIGVNHRNLWNFEIDMTLTTRLHDRIGGHRAIVAESGVGRAVDARRQDMGADAVLVGRDADAVSLPRGDCQGAETGVTGEGRFRPSRIQAGFRHLMDRAGGSGAVLRDVAVVVRAVLAEIEKVQ
jgi:hypothetical protein